MTSPDRLNVALTTEHAATYLRSIGHETMTVAALRSHLKRGRAGRRAGEAGPHLFPAPDRPIDGRTPAWSPELLDAWKPLGRGNRTATRKEQP